MRLEHCAFNGTQFIHNSAKPAQNLLAHTTKDAVEATFYSDSSALAVCHLTGFTEEPAPPEADFEIAQFPECKMVGPKPLADAKSVPFLSNTSAWLLQQKKVTSFYPCNIPCCIHSTHKQMPSILTPAMIDVSGMCIQQRHLSVLSIG